MSKEKINKKNAESVLENTEQYKDIIHLPHHVSETRPRMPLSERAAQFAPFAALTEYGEVIRRTEVRHISDSMERIKYREEI